MRFTLAPRPPFRLDLTVWALRRRAHNLVDLDARQLRRIDACRSHHRQADDLRRPPTLLRHADERIDQTQLGDDLGRTRQERADPHALTISLKAAEASSSHTCGAHG